MPYRGECPTCRSHSLRLGGTGTQKIEEELARLFPEARILRMDADAAGSKSSYERMITAFSNGEYDILVGTQMVAKGLDFPNVTLVGVLNTDHALYADDYRSYERAFSLLTQVVGRSGRGKEKGSAVIQTYTPDNLIISMAAKQDYAALLQHRDQRSERHALSAFRGYLPDWLCRGNQTQTLEAANELLKDFVQARRSETIALAAPYLGPSPALVVKVSNKYRYKLIIKCRNTRQFRRCCHRC